MSPEYLTWSPSLIGFLVFMIWWCFLIPPLAFYCYGLVIVVESSIEPLPFIIICRAVPVVRDHNCLVLLKGLELFNQFLNGHSGLHCWIARLMAISTWLAGKTACTSPISIRIRHSLSTLETMSANVVGSWVYVPLLLGVSWWIIVVVFIWMHGEIGLVTETTDAYRPHLLNAGIDEPSASPGRIALFCRLGLKLALRQEPKRAFRYGCCPASVA